MFAIAISNSPNAQIVLDPAGPHDAEIDEARALLMARKPNDARAILERKKRRHWDEMTARQRYRVAANIGAACLQLGEQADASKAFILAGEQLPDDPDAQAFRAWGLELRGQRQQAFEIASRAVKEHHNKRAVGVYVRCAPGDASISSLEEDLGDLKSEGEALVALSVRAVNARAFEKALPYVDKLISQHPESPDGFLLRGQALMHEQLAKFQGSDIGQVSTLDKKRLAEADEALTRAIDLAKTMGNVAPANETQGTALFVRHQVRFMLDQRDASDGDLEEAWRLQPHDPDVLVGKAIAIREHSKQLAVKYLERAAQVSGDARVHFLYGEILIACDRVEAGVAELLSLGHAKRPFSTEAIATVVEAWSMRGHVEEAEKLVKESDIPEGSRRALGARLEITKGNREAAAANALEAHRALTSKDPPDVRRLLAHTLQELGLNEQAFDVWNSFVVHGVDSPDFRSFLRCAYYAGKHGLVLEACSKFSAQGMSSRFYVSLECYVLQVYDPERAFTRLSQAVVDFPDDTELSFLYACVALRTGRQDEAAKALVPGRIPSPRTTSLDVAPLVARALLEVGRQDEAVSFAYSFVRTHWDDAEAHHLYVTTLMSAPEARAEQPRVTGVDTAVCYRDDEGRESWIVLETDGVDVQLALNEATVGSALGAAFAGKVVGDTFVLSGGVEPRTVEIVALQNKYSFRLQDVMNNYQGRFPASEVVQSFKVPDDPVELVSVGSPLLRAAVQRRDYVQSLSGAYGDGALTMCGLAQALGADPVGCQLGLAGSTVGVRCALPDPRLHQLAGEALAVRNELFVDTSAMATWILLDLGNDAAQWPWRLVTTASCIDVLRSFIKDMRDTRELGGLGIHDGSVSITPRDKTVAQAVAERAERLASLLILVDSRPLAAVEKGRREHLEQLFGQWGAEAIVCGAQPERVLWTDDMLMARVAAAVGAVPASTQAVVNAAVARKVLPAARELEIGTSLFMANYEPLNAPNELIRHIASSSKWQVTAEPLARLIEKLPGFSRGPSKQGSRGRRGPYASLSPSCEHGQGR